MVRHQKKVLNDVTFPPAYRRTNLLKMKHVYSIKKGILAEEFG